MSVCACVFVRVCVCVRVYPNLKVLKENARIRLSLFTFKSTNIFFARARNLLQLVHLRH